MTRLTIPSEEVLGENYTITNITASNYNPQIDSTVTVTVTVTDVYGDPVANKYVTTTCNIGKFTKLNNQTISDTQSVTTQTDSNGEISLTYTGSEWGLVTFSANNYHDQINVAGWKEVWRNTSSDPKIQVFRNADHCRLKFSAYTVSSMNTTFTQYGSTNFLDNWKPSQAILFIGYDYTFLIRVGDDGKLYWRTVTGTLSNKNLYGQYEWSIA